MIEWVIFILSFVVVYHWINMKPKNFPPGPPVVPFLGSIPFIESKNFHLYLEKIRPKYGPVIGFKFGPALDAVAVCGPPEVVEVLKREEFAERPQRIIQQRNGVQGVMFANGEHWREQRRFTVRHLRDFGFGTRLVSDLVADEVQEFCEKLLEGQKIIEVSGIFNTSAVNILWAMMAGTRNSYDDQHFKELLVLLNKLFRHGNVTGGINNFLPLKKLISLVYEFEDDYIDRKLKEFFQRAINEHKRTKTGTPRDLLDVYLTELENPKTESFTEETLQEVLRDLFAAGTESSSNSVSFALMYLILYPEWQQKLYEEIADNLGDRVPAIEDRLRLPKVEAFLTEVSRCNTIAPLSIPRAAAKDTQINGYRVRQGTFVAISIWALLQDKNHWGDPENFRPDRHLSQDGKFVKDPYMVLFGAGPRICLGENLARNFVFLFVVSLLQRYKFTLPHGESKPCTICEPGFTTAPKPFKAALQKR